MYLTSDGDVDVFVDMPQNLLFGELKRRLRPAPRVSGHLGSTTAEIHWKVYISLSSASGISSYCLF